MKVIDHTPEPPKRREPLNPRLISIRIRSLRGGWNSRDQHHDQTTAQSAH
jgi:hypothetical protein